MSLIERYGRTRTSVAKSPPTPAPTCPHYDPPPGLRRCRSYNPDGSCSRPDELMCVEWQKANDPSYRPADVKVEPVAPVISEPEVLRDLFGVPVKPPQPKKARGPLAPPAKSGLPPRPRPVPVVRNVTNADIASFKERGIAVCLGNDAAGDVWIVPKYTDGDRMEISIEHAALIAAVGSVFPGAQVLAMEKMTEGEGGHGGQGDHGGEGVHRGDEAAAGAPVAPAHRNETTNTCAPTTACSN